MLVNTELLHELLPNATDRAVSIFVSPLNTAMKEFHIDTPKRIAAFIAQIGYESGQLKYVEEIASGSAYEFRQDLGNLEFEALQIAHANYSTTGKWYKGRGLIQCTGYYNYRACAKALGIDCLYSPKLLCEPVNAARSAAWYWDVHSCNALADVLLFNKITKVINGGYNGKAERLMLYVNNCQILQVT